MRQHAFCIALAAALSVSLSCRKESTTSEKPRSTQEKSATTHGKADAKRRDLYIEVSARGSLEYFNDHKLGMKLAAQLLGVETDYVGPADGDMAMMVQHLQLAVARKPAGLVVVGFDDSLIPAVNQAADAGIPVVTVDADLPGSKRIAFVGTGNFNAGYQGGLKVADLIAGAGKVALLTKLGQSNLNERVEGYKAALAKYPKIEIVQVGNTESDSLRAAQVTTSLLQSYGDLAAIACVEAAGGTGAATAIKEAGKVGKVKIVAMDRDVPTLKYVEDGVIQATVVQQTALMPLYAVMILYQLNHLDAPITSDNQAAKVTGCPTVVDTGVIIVDKNNYKYFLERRL
ncbi:substrate-binding domain-containing protein [Candidatus Sumerlaeota bacterium]|nr:substrate-binding domain-containing protein [Candidatus Sumerlaeota bacterium]